MRASQHRGPASAACMVGWVVPSAVCSGEKQGLAQHATEYLKSLVASECSTKTTQAPCGRPSEQFSRPRAAKHEAFPTSVVIVPSSSMVSAGESSLLAALAARRVSNVACGGANRTRAALASAGARGHCRPLHVHVYPAAARACVATSRDAFSHSCTVIVAVLL